MPPEVRYTKEKIIDEAFNFVEEKGIHHLSARNVAKRLNMSLAPIYSSFNSMDDQMDAELFFSLNPDSNYGFTGVAVKYAVINDQNSKWRASVRGSYMTLLGVEDMRLNQIAADFLVSRDLWYFMPYMGGALALSQGVETTNKVNLTNETPISPMAIIGTQFVWKYFSAGIEIDFGKLQVTSFKIGGTF